MNAYEIYKKDEDYFREPSIEYELQPGDYFLVEYSTLECYGKVISVGTDHIIADSVTKWKDLPGTWESKNDRLVSIFNTIKTRTCPLLVRPEEIVI